MDINFFHDFSSSKMAQLDNDAKLFQNKIKNHVQVKKRAALNISIENKRIIVSGSKCVIDKIKNCIDGELIAAIWYNDL